MHWSEHLTEVQDDDEVLSDDSGDEWFDPRGASGDDDEGSDMDADIEESHGPSTSSEKQRFQNEIFRDFAARTTEKSAEKEVKDIEALELENAKDDDLSIRAILAKQENSARITNPRDYQTELFQRAKEENIIAVLDTGSGKTHIATLLLRHILDVELEARKSGAPHKIAFFLVDSVNLVFQQANVLQCGLDQQVTGLSGSMGTALWQKKSWDTHFANNMVIVCTAAVLLECMMHSFISMAQVNLLIFDEAHHAKSNHPYARIIKDFYLGELDLSKRPRIFGMTASPVDANVDVRQAAVDLENLLHSKIATASDLALLSNHINRPSEDVAVYPRLPEPYETPFHQELKRRWGHIPVFRKLFYDSKLFSSELGRWASDAYWTYAFSEKQSRKIQLRQERIFNKAEEQSIEKLDKEIKQLQEAAEFMKNHDFGSPTASPADLSSKVLKLHDWLRLYYTRTGEARCIIFVNRRQTARLLNMIFKYIGGPNLHCDLLVGSNSMYSDTASLRSQIMTVAKFRRGDINCLFATSVAEEGLDIPQCNLVVRFDLYKTMIAYVQSRGRARHKNSKYLHMCELGNLEHRTAVFNAKSSEQVMRNFCNSLSTDRLLNEDDVNIKPFTDEDEPPSILTKSGAKLTYWSSLVVLAHFVSRLPAANQEVELVPNYIMDHSGGMFLCEVILPDCSPVISMQGQPQRRKALAKCSAAYQMCLVLYEKGFLDQNLLPTFIKHAPAMRNAHLAVSSKKKDVYAMRIKPEFWDLGYGTLPETLYLTVIDAGAGLERPHQPIGLITRACFPQMPEFPIYLADGRPSPVISTSLVAPFPATGDRLKLFTTLTLQIYQDLFAKTFKYDEQRMSYWLVPLRTDRTASVTPFDNPEYLIDWDQVNEVCEKKEYRWSDKMSHDLLADKYFVDTHDGGRRFYSLHVAPHLKATDPVPDTAPKYRYMENILDYSISLFKNSRAKWAHAWDREQPVVEVEKIPFRRNLLARVETDEHEVKFKPKAYVCPQPFKISALTTRFVAMLYVFPAIIHRFESYMIALDASNRLGLDISPRLALEALTKDSENSEEHGEEQIRFKSGMGPNYERLEFMGDCFLKMATSISTFVLQPDENEFEFHVRRMVMLCNKNLKDAAMKYNLYEYVRTLAFSRRTWYPERLILEKGKGSAAEDNGEKKAMHHRLADKSIADVCEAFIGAAFMEHNKVDSWEASTWDQAVKAVTTLVDSEDHMMQTFSEYYAAYNKPKYQLAEATASQLDLARKIEQKHPYHFKYPRLLRSAFVHPSQAFMWENIPNYQRLEFLGDSLLDQVFIMHLFYRYPDKDPQWLTEHKMPMVSNHFLSAVCVALGFHNHIRQNNAILTSQIRDYVAEVQEAEREAKGKGKVDYWMAVSNPPKCLADVVEAYVGAMFVDSSFDFSVVQKFFDMHLKHFMEDMTIFDGYANNHPSTRLTNLMQVNFGCQNWKIATAAIQSVIPGVKERRIGMVQIHYKVHFYAISDSNRYVRVKVAKAALESLEGLAPYEFKRLYGCDCVDETELADGEAEGGMEGVIASQG